MTLYRPRDDRMIAGVCSGIARRFNIDPTIVRIAFVASLFLPGPQILIYLVAWLLMPDEATTTRLIIDESPSVAMTEGLCRAN